MTDGRPLRVATVITRLEGGAGQHALRAARTMDPAAFTMTIITGSGDELVAEAVGFLLDTPEAAARMAATARSRLGTRSGAQALRHALMAAYSGGYAVAYAGHD
jgi:hypothetical protein